MAEATRKRARAAAAPKTEGTPVQPSPEKNYRVKLTGVGDIGGMMLSPRDNLEVSAAGLAMLQDQGVVGSFEEVTPPVTEGAAGDEPEV